ncbi:MAG: PQQ-dependent sugar dehydrogenase [Micrococcales bacterium]|nr:PQQ-dependent sugar dehydrogenase [Micrococcales bacterium]
MKRLALCIAALLVLAGCGQNDSPAPVTPASPTSTPSVTPTPAAEPTLDGDVATGLQAPWSVVPLSGDRALISERNTARILLLANGTAKAIVNLPEVLPGGEGGLLGLAVQSPDPDTVFAYYTSAVDNRVVAFDFDGSNLSNERPVFTGIPKGQIHNGGRIAFGPDGYLYVTTGETGQPDLAQDRTSLGGKILRITPRGRPAPGNPEPDSPVWSYGHRNVQGLAWDDQDRLWATEFGQSDVDELNLIEPGGNYGWPRCEGNCNVPGMANPKATWSPTSTASPSGLAIVDGSAWVAALRGEALYEVPLDGTRAENPKAWFDGDLGRIRDVVASPTGGLWLLTNNTDGRGQPRSGDDRLVAVGL